MKIIIVGYGWLGRQLALPLQQDGHQLFVTRRSEDGLADLPATLKGLQLDLQQADLTENKQLLELFNDALVLCAIAPGRSASWDNYHNSLQNLYLLIRQAQSRAIVHFSSTGIYQGNVGAVDECTELQLHLPKVQLLSAGEQALQQFQHCITLRLAGLMGPGRHPGKSVAGKTLPAPQAPVNMLHSDDILYAVRALILKQDWQSDVFNLSSPAFVSREAFYKCAVALASSEVSFSTEAVPSRRVTSEKFIRRFDFQYRFASASDALMHCF